jgi:S-adenosylmethionine decarboxylase proenzyme
MAKPRSTGDTGKPEVATTPKPADVDNPFTISLSLLFIVSTMVGVAVVAFAVGRLSVSLVLLKHGVTTADVAWTDSGSRALPRPFYSEQKQIPHTVYSSKHYDTGAVTTSDTLLARRAHFGQSQEVNPDGTLADKDNEQTDEELHEPSGQHLLVDIKSVEGTFLNSEDRLARAMMNLVELSGLTMLSYHCHGLTPVGVSCVGVLLESHISFHTWPIPGVISLDLFTCGPKSLLPLLSQIERLFGVPRWPAVQGDVVEEPFMQWAHKKRGFRSVAGNPQDVDLNQFILGWMEFDMKQLVVSVKSDFQTIEIYDLINPRFRSLESYKRSLANDGSYEARHPELFRPDRVVYLDGTMQSRFYGDAAYHEALVHPAMITHPKPKRVAIIGGGEGATLREVLKHKTVETVTMIEIDEIMVNVSRKHIPEWSDCSKLVGSTSSCFDDPRAEIYYTDAIAWFIDRFLDIDKVDGSQFYDVIIMDLL